MCDYGMVVSDLKIHQQEKDNQMEEDFFKNKQFKEMLFMKEIVRQQNPDLVRFT